MLFMDVPVVVVEAVLNLYVLTIWKMSSNKQTNMFLYPFLVATLQYRLTI
jgi:hypothetical protein